MLSDLKYINAALEFIGIHSGNIFMLHTFIYSYYFSRIIYAPYYPILILLSLLLISLAISFGLEKLKALLEYKRLNDLLFKAGGFLK